MLVFAGTGAIVTNEASAGAVTHVALLTFGLVVLAMIYTVGEALRAAVHREPVHRCARASLTLLFLFPRSRTLGETLPAGSLLQSFILEVC